MTRCTFTLPAGGGFSLAAASRFGRGFPPSPTRGDDAQLLLAFAVEHADWRTAGVRLTQPADAVRGEVAGDIDPGAVAVQVERILSLDIDGDGFRAVGERDAVVGELQQRYPGLRPVLFCSPYEAAAWTIISQRVRMSQAAAVKARLAEQLGVAVAVGGETLHAFPSPQRLARLADDTRGLTPRKHQQLRSLAQAALDGHLDASALRALPPEDALAHLERLPGIGPFSAELILVRGAGHPDHFPANEPRLHRAMRARYGLPDDTPPDALAHLAEAWRPYRAWVALLFRRALADAG